ncbi:MAG: hypothetical protein N2747_01780 [Chitinophagaceae bacterium]|nr:hypothetical protein [Chitinophagaceae bacterium]
MNHLRLWMLYLLCVTGFISCDRSAYITTPDAILAFSADTLRFDTVFVTTGSTYRRLTIINQNNKKLKLNLIKVAGGNASAFKLNVDGISGNTFSNIDLNARDSIYLFVQVNVNPASGNLPFIIRDSIQVSYNGKDRYIQLEAWGRNARFMRNKVITANETWNNDLPYVITGFLRIEPNQTLTINKGCRIYVNANAPILVNGTLKVNGLKDSADRVYFQGDRLDEPYKDYPASWPGIFFLQNAVNNVLQYAVIQNAYQAIVVTAPSSNGQPKVVLNECIVDNAYDAGIITQNSSVSARNCLITNCGKNLVFTFGGAYDFTHCTVASYGNRYIQHKAPVLYLNNFSGAATQPLSALFRNCIFWGDNGIVNNEVVVEKTGSTPFTVVFDHSLWKVQNTPTHVTTNQIIQNQNPVFDSINTVKNFYNFRLKSASPAINKGVITPIPTDLDGKPRAVGLPDLGCFEKQ